MLWELFSVRLTGKLKFVFELDGLAGLNLQTNFTTWKSINLISNTGCFHNTMNGLIVYDWKPLVYRVFRVKLFHWFIYRLRFGKRSANVFGSVLVHKTRCSVPSRVCRIEPALDQVFGIGGSVVRNDYHSLRIPIFVA